MIAGGKSGNAQKSDEGQPDDRVEVGLASLVHYILPIELHGEGDASCHDAENVHLGGIRR